MNTIFRLPNPQKIRVQGCVLMKIFSKSQFEDRIGNLHPTNIYKYMVYLEPSHDLYCLKVNPLKQVLFQLKQRSSFGFQATIFQSEIMNLPSGL